MGPQPKDHCNAYPGSKVSQEARKSLAYNPAWPAGLGRGSIRLANGGRTCNELPDPSTLPNYVELVQLELSFTLTERGERIGIDKLGQRLAPYGFERMSDGKPSYGIRCAVVEKRGKMRF